MAKVDRNSQIYPGSHSITSSLLATWSESGSIVDQAVKDLSMGLDENAKQLDHVDLAKVDGLSEYVVALADLKARGKAVIEKVASYD